MQKYFRRFILKKRKKVELYIESEKNNSKLAEELFEIGNEGKEKRKTMRLLSNGMLDNQTTEAKLKKEPELNNEQVLEQLMDKSKK